MTNKFNSRNELAQAMWDHMDRGGAELDGNDLVKIFDWVSSKDFQFLEGKGVWELCGEYEKETK